MKLAKREDIPAAAEEEAGQTPSNKAFVPLMAEQLGAEMSLRSKGVPPDAYAREAEAIKSKIAELTGRSAMDPGLQNAQNIC